MATLHIETNAPEVVGLMGRLFRDQVPFALSKAINAVAKEAQVRQRAHHRMIFKVRRPQFVDRATKIKPFATKRRLFAVVRIDPPGGRSRADIISKFESQRVKRPRSGRSIAVPIDARRTKSGVVSKATRPRNLQLSGRGGGRVQRGNRRTFLIRTAQGGGIYQRLGRGKNSRVRLLFALRRSVPITPELRFTGNIADTVDRRFRPLFFREFDREVRTAR